MKIVGPKRKAIGTYSDPAIAKSNFYVFSKTHLTASSHLLLRPRSGVFTSGIPTSTLLRADLNCVVYNYAIYSNLHSLKLQIFSQLLFLEHTHYDANVNIWMFETPLKMVPAAKHVALL
jgi:hypothetical protein